MKKRQQQIFDLFENENKMKIVLFCPECEEELNPQSSDSVLCKKCNKTIPIAEAKDDVSIEYIFGIKAE